MPTGRRSSCARARGPRARMLPRRQIAQPAAQVNVVPELGCDHTRQAQVHDDPPGRESAGSGPARHARGRSPRDRTSLSRASDSGLRS